MEWVFIVGAVFVVMVVFGTKAEMKKNALKVERTNLYSAEIETFKQSLLTGSNTASLPVLQTSDYGYRPVASENLLAVQDGATRMEMKSTGRYKTGGASVSIPIMKGVRYRVGSGTIRTEKSWQATAHGRLLVTDKAIVFEGGAKNERITWTQVANVELLLDGFTIAKRSGPPRTYQVDTPNPKFAAVIELMLARTT
ncbi:MAG: hypothetical protein FD150_533 [Rhodobacteraceae bacterium]|nr:MAG: hypothetical protein FD150_533 [Paracoccaceae bacterium]